MCVCLSLSLSLCVCVHVCVHACVHKQFNKRMLNDGEYNVGWDYEVGDDLNIGNIHVTVVSTMSLWCPPCHRGVHHLDHSHLP